MQLKSFQDGFLSRLVRTLSFLCRESLFSNLSIDFKKLGGGSIGNVILSQNSRKLSIGNKNDFLLQELLEN